MAEWLVGGKPALLAATQANSGEVALRQKSQAIEHLHRVKPMSDRYLL
jgi:hypothetical protein